MGVHYLQANQLQKTYRSWQKVKSLAAVQFTTRTALTRYSTTQNNSINPLARTRHNCTLAQCVLSELRQLLVINILQSDFPSCHHCQGQGCSREWTTVHGGIEQVSTGTDSAVDCNYVIFLAAVTSPWCLRWLSRYSDGCRIMKFHSTPVWCRC